MRWSPSRKGAEPPWAALFEAGSALKTFLGDSDSLIAAFDDALKATCQERVEDAIVALAPRLDELRGIAELQRGPWARTKNTIEHHLMSSERRDEESPSLGLYPPGTEAAVVLAALREALRTPIHDQEWAVWISTLAGPAPEAEAPVGVIVSGPVAVSGRPCTGELGCWLVQVRKDIATAFSAAGREVPPDVLALGEPARFRGSVLLDGDQLWSRVASPPSFVARVAVRPTSSEEAIDEAREALRAVYGFSESGLPGDVRDDATRRSPAGRGAPKIGSAPAARSCACKYRSAWVFPVPRRPERIWWSRDSRLENNVPASTNVSTNISGSAPSARRTSFIKAKLVSRGTGPSLRAPRSPQTLKLARHPPAEPLRRACASDVLQPWNERVGVTAPSDV